MRSYSCSASDMPAADGTAPVKALAAEVGWLFDISGVPPDDRRFAERRIADCVKRVERELSAAPNAATRKQLTDGSMNDIAAQAVSGVNSSLRSLSTRVETLRVRPAPAATLQALALLSQRIAETDSTVISLTRTNSPSATVAALSRGPAVECQYVQTIMESFEATDRASRRWWGQRKDYVVGFIVALIAGLVLIPITIALTVAWERQRQPDAIEDQRHPAAVLPQRDRKPDR